ncbi:MAG: Rieske 2Fe-2S domain-containing protein [Dehalococcoidales bacterium]
MRYLSAGRGLDDLADGAMTELWLEDFRVLLARVGDVCYAADAACPHMGGRLAHGHLEGTIVTCPRHGSQFDLKDGQVVRWLKGSGPVPRFFTWLKPPRRLRTYNVKIERGEVLVAVPD